MYMNEGATATLAVETGDRGFRFEADETPRPAGRGPRPRAKRLIAQLARETSVRARAECINALTKLEAKEGLPAIENALDDECAAVRLAAVRGVYRLAGREGAGLLVRMLHDASEDVRRRAAACLGWLDHKPAAVDLLPLLADSSGFVRGAAVDALANLGSSRAFPKIAELLEDPVESVRKRAHLALQTIIKTTAMRTDTRRYRRTHTGGRMAETSPEQGCLSTDAQATGVANRAEGKPQRLPHSRPLGRAGSPTLAHSFAA